MNLTGFNKRGKLASIILLLGISITVLYFHNQISGFMPMHKARAFEVIEQGRLLGQRTERTPGYYTLAGAIFSVTNVSNYHSLFFPFSLAPFLAILFSLHRRISSSSLLASFIVVIYFASGRRGTSELFLGLHGVGVMLSFALILTTLLLLSDWPRRRGYLIIGCLLSITLTYVSYNWSLYTGIFLGILLLYSSAVKLTHYPVDEISYFNWLTRPIHRLLFIIIIITVATHTFLNNFLRFFLPYFLSTYDGEETLYAPIRRFVVTWFGETPGAGSEIAHLYVQTPSLATYVSIAKYVVFAASLVYFIFIIYSDRTLNYRSIVILSFTSATAILLLARFFVGSFSITLLFYPSILCISSIYESIDNSHNLRRAFLSVAVLTLLVTSLIYFPIFVSYGFESDDKESFTRSKAPSKWQQEFVDREVRTDVDTRGLILFHTRGTDYESYPGVNSNRIVAPMDSDDALAVLNSRDRLRYDGLFILDFGSKSISLIQWQTLIGWDQSNNRILSNYRINFVYSDGRYRYASYNTTR